MCIRDRLELVEMEVSELLSKYEFPGDDTPIISGSARMALEGDQSEIGVPSIIKLVEALDSWIPEPVSYTHLDVYKRQVFPEPVISMAVEPKTKSDQEKMGIALGLSLIHI